MESLVDYSPIGPRFSNVIVQTIQVLVKRAPPKEGRRILIIATTSEKMFFEQSGLAARFAYSFEMPLVGSADSLRVVLSSRNREKRDFPSDEIDLVCQSILDPIGIQKLLMVTETAAQFCKPGRIKCDKFLECLQLAGIQ